MVRVDATMNNSINNSRVCNSRFTFIRAVCVGVCAADRNRHFVYVCVVLFCLRVGGTLRLRERERERASARTRCRCGVGLSVLSALCLLL